MSEERSADDEEVSRFAHCEMRWSIRVSFFLVAPFALFISFPACLASTGLHYWGPYFCFERKWYTSCRIRDSSEYWCWSRYVLRIWDLAGSDMRKHDPRWRTCRDNFVPSSDCRNAQRLVLHFPGFIELRAQRSNVFRNFRKLNGDKWRSHDSSTNSGRLPRRRAYGLRIQPLWCLAPFWQENFHWLSPECKPMQAADGEKLHRNHCMGIACS